MCAALGGIVAQEGLKAITGKFTPLKQWVCKSLSLITVDKTLHHELGIISMVGWTIIITVDTSISWSESERVLSTFK